MSNPGHFFLNPQQQSMVRRDQYWPETTGTPASGSLGMSYLDNRGNPQTLDAPQQDIYCQVISVDGDITDSNDYYIVQQLNAWFDFGPDLQAIMRLDSEDTLAEGDNVQAIFYATTTDSPDPDDDGFALLQPISTNSSSSGGDGSFWASVDGPYLTCSDEIPIAYAWQEQIPLTCGTWMDGPRSGTQGCQLQITVLTVGNSSSVHASWFVLFDPPIILGSWTIPIDGTSGGTFTQATTASDIDTGFGTTTTTGNILAGFTITYSADFAPHTMTSTTANLVPGPDLMAYEVNQQTNFDTGKIVRLWPGGGAVGSIDVVKTQTGDGSSIPTKYTMTQDSNVVSGYFTVQLDGGTVSSNLALGISDTDLATAITDCTVAGTDLIAGFTITFSDNDDHTLTVVAVLEDTRTYTFSSPQPDPITCINSINGLTLTDLPGYDPSVLCVLTMNAGTGCLQWSATEQCSVIGGD